MATDSQSESRDLLNVAKVGEEISITFDDCPITDSDLSTATAQVHGVMSNHVFGRATIVSIIEKIEWGKFDEDLACLVGFLIYFDPPKHRHMTYAEYHVRIDTNSPGPTEAIASPSLLYCRPERIDGPPKIVKHKTAKNFSPNVQVGGIGGGFGHILTEDELEKVFRWSLKGMPIVRRAQQVGAKWRLMQDEKREGVPHQIKLGILVRHFGQPFQFSLTAEGKTSAWDTIRDGFMNSRRDEDRDGPEVRTLEPDPVKSENQLTLKMLEEYVGLGIPDIIKVPG